MKNLFKKINIFGLGLILAAGTVFITQSAFKSTKITTGQLYGYYPNPSPGSPHWVNITGGIKLGEEGDGEVATYVCDSAPQTCTATFDDGIDPNLVNTEDPQGPNYVEPTIEDEGEFNSI